MGKDLSIFSAASIVLMMTVGPAVAEAKQVTLWGRVWTVTPEDGEGNQWRAVRDNNGNNPFGKPALPRTMQGVRALEVASGCKVIHSGLVQTITGAYIAPMRCK